MLTYTSSNGGHVIRHILYICQTHFYVFLVVTFSATPFHRNQIQNKEMVFFLPLLWKVYLHVSVQGHSQWVCLHGILLPPHPPPLTPPPAKKRKIETDRIKDKKEGKGKREQRETSKIIMLTKQLLQRRVSHFNFYTLLIQIQKFGNSTPYLPSIGELASLPITREYPLPNTGYAPGVDNTIRVNTLVTGN